MASSQQSKDEGMKVGESPQDGGKQQQNGAPGKERGEGGGLTRPGIHYLGTHTHAHLERGGGGEEGLGCLRREREQGWLQTRDGF